MQKYKVYFWKYLPKQYFKEIKERYKDRRKDYMNIYICDSFEEMYNLSDKLEKAKLERDYAARTRCYDMNYWNIETGEYVKTSPLCGHIVFNKEYFYISSIAHESTHAVIGYFNRKLKDCQNIFSKCDEKGNMLEEEISPDSDLEELFSYMLGNIADQIAQGYREDIKESKE